MSEINRRDMLHVLGAAPAAAMALGWTPADAAAAVREIGRQTLNAQPYQLRFFTPREYATVVALSDLILPKDARSGSASDAGAPAFVDYIVAEQPERQTAMRGGLVWLDSECRRRFDKAFLECSDAERRRVLDDIAYPRKARPEMSHGVRFFTSLRDLVATGFWSSRVGVDDLGYSGNRPTQWDGPPPEVLKKLGL
jgi:gluconate 2-dehydrogenase gamma chain